MNVLGKQTDERIGTLW